MTSRRQRQHDVDVSDELVLDVGVGPAAGRGHRPHELRRVDAAVDERLVRRERRQTSQHRHTAATHRQRVVHRPTDRPPHTVTLCRPPDSS